MRHTHSPRAVTPLRLIEPRELPRGVALAAAVAPVTVSSSGDASHLAPMVLWALLALALAVVVVAAAPPRVLPAGVAFAFAERRGSLLYIGTATLVAIAVGVVIALVGS
jgi:hypothetical protein